MDTFLLVIAALFPVVNPPGSALVFLSMTKRAPVAVRRSLARRVALNSFFVMAASLLVGTFILKAYGISVPVLRVAGGMIVAMAGLKLLNEGSDKGTSEPQAPDKKIDYESLAFIL
jgi:multiple antibiotic resistance protein